MKFNLTAILVTSLNITNYKNEIINYLKNAENTFLSKGAPAENGAKVKVLNIKDNNIELLITSGKYVRSHDALLRIKKNISIFLGSKFKIGIRSIDIIKFIIQIPSDGYKININIPYIKSFIFKENYLEIELKINEKDIQKQIPDRIINLIEEKINKEKYGSKSEHWTLLWESEDKIFNYFIDPTSEMIKKKWIQRGSNRGQWIYGPEITKIFKTFEKIVEVEILKKLDFNEMIFPKLVTWDVWKKSGHANGIYPEMYYVCTPNTRDPKYWEDVIDYYKITHEIPKKLLKEKISDPIGGLCYAQCPPSWLFFQGKTISNDSLPIKIYDRSGTSHRYESGGIHGIERVDEFHRIEIVWIGNKESVIKISKDLHERYSFIFNKILNLKWRKAWVTPWFMAQEGLNGLSEDNNVGTTDYEAPLPYRGSNSEWLEFQNLSINGIKYPKGFNVKSQNGEQLWSGCSGIGMERWASVFLSQYGLNPNNWPKEFIEYFGSYPKEIKFL